MFKSYAKKSSSLNYLCMHIIHLEILSSIENLKVIYNMIWLLHSRNILFEAIGMKYEITRW